MKIVRNAGGDRVIDLVRPWLTEGSLLDLVTPSFSLFAFAELARELSRLAKARVVLPGGDDELGLVGTDADRGARNRLQTPWLARRCADWLSAKVEVRRAAGRVPQGTIVLRDSGSQPQQVLLGSLALSTDGLGLTPGNTLNLIQASEGEAESALLSAWFDAQWQSLATGGAATSDLVAQLRSLSAPRAPFTIYTLMLHHLFSNSAEDLDEDRVVNAATGIRNTVVWKKLFRFQRDGVVGALDKLNRYGGCIIADSVGLGKTFEALAIIKYHELRNDRVLVL